MNEGFPILKMPSETTIDIWLIDLDSPLNPGVHLDKFLSLEERNRAERYIFARDAHRFTRCRAMLRLGLACYLAKTPASITFASNPYGKPRLAEPSALHFNVTHSGGLGLIAFATAGEVGVDVEAIRSNTGALEIASEHFTKNEAAMIAAAPTPQEQASTFLRFWTRKEAVLKAAGCGLLMRLDLVDVSQAHLNLVRLDDSAGGSAETYWRVQDLDLMDGFTGAVAAPAGTLKVQQRRVRYEDLINGFAGNFAEQL
jgi:4'-phosphopantetheinyl transferase